MQKVKFNQLRGTPAQTYRHRICLAVTVGSLFISVLTWRLLQKVNPDARKRWEKIEQPITYFKSRGWKPTSMQINTKFSDDEL